jgi:hypothetical protein
MSALALLNPGCSFMFVNGPGSKPERTDCTDSYAWPVVDTGLSAFELLRIMYDSSRSAEDFKGTPLSKEGSITIGAILLLTAAGSAAYGYTKVSDCKEANEATRGPDPERVAAALRRARRLKEERDKAAAQEGGGFPSPQPSPASAPTQAAPAAGSTTTVPTPTRQVRDDE